MASGKAVTLENAILNNVFRGAAMSFTPYLALFTDDGSAEPTTEVTGTSYARVAVSSSNFTSAASGSSISNTVAIEFPTSGGAWASSADIRSAAIMDASTSGNILYWLALSAPYQKVTGSNQIVRFAIGALTFGET